MVVAAFLCIVGAHAAVNTAKVTPVEKVVSLLEKLVGEVQAEGKVEAAAYDKFSCFCKEQADDKFYAITKSKKLIAMQTAQIKQLVAEIDDLNLEIKDLKVKKKELEGEAKTALEARDKEYETYAEKAKDLADAVDAVGRAIEALEQSKEGMVDAKLSLRQTLPRQALEKVAVTSSHPTRDQVRAVLALLDVHGEPGQPAAFKYGSNDIIATLKGLQKTFKKEKVECDTEEAGKRQDYELKAQARSNTIKFTMEAIDQKAKMASDKEEEQNQIQKDMDAETADKEADEAFLEELTELGEGKAKEFDQRSSTRSAEITALSEALGILKSGVQPNYGANKKLNLVASKNALKTGAAVNKAVHGHWVWVADSDSKSEGPTNFLQIHTSASESVPDKLLGFLTKKAEVLKSAAISTLLMKIRLGVGKDHFVKVRGIIKDLVAKLEADAESEASQKSFCDEAMSEAITNRDDANGKKEEETANIASSESKIADLVQEIDDLANQVAELRKGLFEATELRAKEKAENEKTLAEATEGKDAIESAIKVLKKFYGEFIQTGFVPAGAGRDGKTVSDLAPDTGTSGEYGGNKDAAKGIFGFLEVIQSDFEATLKTTEEAEEKAQSDFETFEEDTNGDIEKKSDRKKEAEKEKEDEEASLVGYQDELKTAKESHTDAEKELEKLKPMCVDTGSSWEEQRARQKQEIDALKQALAILEDWQK